MTAIEENSGYMDILPMSLGRLLALHLLRSLKELLWKHLKKKMRQRMTLTKTLPYLWKGSIRLWSSERRALYQEVKTWRKKVPSRSLSLGKRGPKGKMSDALSVVGLVTLPLIVLITMTRRRVKWWPPHGVVVVMTPMREISLRVMKNSWLTS